MMRRRFFPFWLAITSVLFAAALFAAFYYSRSLSARTLDERRQNLEEAVQSGITGCYALEGRYPPSIEYLEEKYGLQIDRTSFYVDYRPIAANIRPDVYILTRNAAAEDADR